MKILKEIASKLWAVVRCIQIPFITRLLQLLYWVAVDFVRTIKAGKKNHMYGIWCFVGMYGGGKTMSLVRYLEDMRAKHGNKIYIASNFFYKGQDFPINTWKDLLPEYDRPVIFAYDELQNEFNSREYKDFPVSLMTLLTQNRKGNGKQIVYTVQDYETVDKNFRRMTKTVIMCRTILGRLTKCRYYPREVFESLTASSDVGKRMKQRPSKKQYFVQTDYLRNQYDSFKMLDSAKNKQYTERVSQP